MRRFIISVLMASAVAGVAAGVISFDKPPVASGEVEAATPPPGMMPGGPLLGPLKLEEAVTDPVAVPEPVWASVLAASVVIFMRRTRR